MEYHLSIRGREQEGPLDLESCPPVWRILNSPPSRELLSTCSSRASHQPHHHRIDRSSLGSDFHLSHRISRSICCQPPQPPQPRGFELNHCDVFTCAYSVGGQDLTPALMRMQSANKTWCFLFYNGRVDSVIPAPPG
jgi:hypothetical protein